MCGRAQQSPTYNLSVAVDEVSLTVQAADAHGLPIDDLKLDELTLLDNGLPPRRILAFESLANAPIRAGFLMDTSQSMLETRATDRAIAAEYAQHLLRQRTDQAFVMNFDFASRAAQPWTSDAFALTQGIRNRSVAASHPVNIGGTALFDALYRACLNQFGTIDHAASANFILLFSDGEDNASQQTLQQAVEVCQHNNVAIYAFRKPESAAGGQTLHRLAAQTGGRVFDDDESQYNIDRDLRSIESGLRSGYRLVYRPPEMKHDGSFHRISVAAAPRVASIKTRSGYYAPTH